MLFLPSLNSRWDAFYLIEGLDGGYRLTPDDAERRKML